MPAREDMAIECKSCGYHVEGVASFCPRCGASLKNEIAGQNLPERPSGLPVPPTPGSASERVHTASNPVSPPWQQPLPGSQAYPYAVQQTEGMCVAALILGLLSLVLIFIPILSWILGLMGIVLGALGIKSVRENAGFKTGYGMGLAGLILGVVGLVGGVILFLVLISISS